MGSLADARLASASDPEGLRSLRCPVVARHIGAVRSERCYELPDALI
jgi:hypothetical protein